ncbi:APN2 DNA lyase apurinic/apyrimidinic [Hortaea werneckii]|nr:APN2 DNA lyase apurinic/apyrimidinic [Hortaea werneckii]
MRLTTWNVNGIRNPFGYQPWNAARTFPAMFDILGSDIVVMQELKIQRKDLRDDMVMIDGWDCYFSLPRHKKGYSGVGVYTRNATCAPIKAEEGLLGVLPSALGQPYCELPEAHRIGGYPSEQQVAELGVDPTLLDAEGRCVVVEFPAFVLLGVYSPANSNGMRDDFRYGFICALDCRIRNLVAEGKRVVLVGDLNVSRDELDSAGAAEDMKKMGITHEDYISTPNRRIFNQLIVEGEVIGKRDSGRERGVLWDTTRAFHPERKGMYTHWEQKINARPGNFGSRIDFVLVSTDMKPWIRDANIQEGLLGSDHCPVFVDFLDDVQCDGKETKLIDIMSPVGVFENQVRQKEWRVQDIPAFSAKRLPEFDKRRSIKSMFSAVPAKKPQGSLPIDSMASKSKAEASGTCATPLLPPNDAGERPEASSIESPAETDRSSLKEHKRKPSSPVKTKPLKKQKTDAEPPKAKGQQSLKGFFSKTTSSPAKSAATEDTERSRQELDGATITAAPQNDADHKANPPLRYETPEPPNGSQLSATGTENTVSPASAMSISPSHINAKLAAVEQNQKSWSSLFSRPVAPLCEGHKEPCKTMQTKKKGSNQGRSFWMCARPLGPSGNKEKGTQWRCPTFIWSSDWQPGKADKAESDVG